MSVLFSRKRTIALLAMCLSISCTFIGAPAAIAVRPPFARSVGGGDQDRGAPAVTSRWSINRPSGTNLNKLEFRGTVSAGPGEGSLYWYNEYRYDDHNAHRWGRIGYIIDNNGNARFLWRTNRDIKKEYKEGLGSRCSTFIYRTAQVECSNETFSGGRLVPTHTYEFGLEIEPKPVDENFYWLKATVKDVTTGISATLGMIQVGGSLGYSTILYSEGKSLVQVVADATSSTEKYLCSDSPHASMRLEAAGQAIPTSGTGEGTHVDALFDEGQDTACSGLIKRKRAADWKMLTVDLGLGNSAQNHLFVGGNRCLDGNSGNDDLVVLPCRNSKNQRFIFTKDGELHSAKGNECLAVFKVPSYPDNRVHTEDCTDPNPADRQWVYDPERHVVAKKADQNYVMAVHDDGKVYLEYYYSSYTSQKMWHTPTFPGPGFHELWAQHSRLCMDVENSSVENGARIVQWGCKHLKEEYGNQQFAFVINDDDSGYGRLINQKSSKAAVVKNASKELNAEVIQWDDNKSDNGFWKPMLIADGIWQFQNKHSGMCLDVASMSVDPGQPFVQEECKFNRDSNQALALHHP